MKSAESSLTARTFQLDETQMYTRNHSEADGHFKLYFAVNKMNF